MVSGGLENEGAQVERLSEEEEIKKTKRILRRMRIQVSALFYLAFQVTGPETVVDLGGYLDWFRYCRCCRRCFHCWCVTIYLATDDQLY